MAQEILNSSNNINQPHNVSIWFQKDFTGSYTELGDLVVDGVTLAPEFSDFRSYRNGVNALRKRILTNRAASITATLNEPNARNLERVLFGSATTSGASVTAYEGKHLTVADLGSGVLGIDLTDAGESDFANITVTGVYDASDVLEATNLISGNLTPNTDGEVDIVDTDSAIAEGDIVYVRYEITISSAYSTQIFGATDATIEGAAQFQSRNLQGGVVQIWALSSVNLAPNGNLSYPVDAVQTVPILLTLQERAGSFGTVYTK